MAKKKIPQTERDKDIRKSNESKVGEITRHLRSYYDVTGPLRTAMKRDLDMQVGGRKQWEEADLVNLDKDKRPALSFNIIHPTINFLSGLQAQRETDYRYFPRGPEDERFGRICTSLVKYAMDKAQGEHQETKQFRLGVGPGMGVLEVGHSYEQTDDLIEGDLTIDCLAMNSWYCDIQARQFNRSDASYQGKLLWVNKDYINKRWPGHEARMSNVWDWLPYDPILTGMPEHFLRELYDDKASRVRLLQHWYRVPVEVVLLVNRAEPDPAKAVTRMPSGKKAEEALQRIRDEAGAEAAGQFKIQTATNAYGVVNLVTGSAMPVLNEEEGQRLIGKISDEAGEKAAESYEVLSRETTALRVAHLTGWELLDDSPSPYEDDWRFPFSPFFCFQDTESYDDIQGVTRGLIDPQKECNWHHATLIDTMMRAPKGATWVNKGDNINILELRKQLSRAGFIGEYTTQPPTYWPSVGFNQGDLAMTEVMNDFVMRYSSVNAEMMGATTQKTVSGRSIGARLTSGLVGSAIIFQHWQQTKQYTGQLLIKRALQFYSIEKMQRILGQQHRMAKLMGLDLNVIMPDEQFYAVLKQVKDLEFDVIVGFQESSATEREAQLNRALQFMGIGIPIPPQALVEMSDVPYKEETLAALQKQGMQQPNPAALQALGGGQGQGANGVNTSQ